MQIFGAASAESHWRRQRRGQAGRRTPACPLMRVAQLATEVGFRPARSTSSPALGHEGGRRAGPPPRHRPHQLHRQPAVGTPDPAGRRRAALPGDARARRQEPADQAVRGDATPTPPSRPSSTPSCRTPARPARPARACWSSNDVRAAAGSAWAKPSSACRAWRRWTGPGPLIRQSQQQRVWDFLSDAQVAGIPVVGAGPRGEAARRRALPGVPRIAARRPVQHRIAQEEVFGPVLAAMAFRDEDHAWSSWPTPRPSAWWPASGRATAGASCGWRAAAQWPGVHQQLRRRWRRRTAVRGVKSSGPRHARRAEALYGLHRPQDRGDPPRLIPAAGFRQPGP